MSNDPAAIYDPSVVADLFDRCAARYRWCSAAASFGLVWAWRRAAARRLFAMSRIAALKGAELPRLPQTLDLMAGTGEAWPHLLHHFPGAQITAIDISAGMQAQALGRIHASQAHRIQHSCADALRAPLEPESADLVICTFGLQTLTPAGQERLAQRIAAVLRPGGSYALIEAGDPRGWALRPLYRLYLDRVLPLIERVALRRAEGFALIGPYTRAFGDCSHMAEALRAQGLFVATRAHMFGCASSVAGFKPPAQVVAPRRASP